MTISFVNLLELKPINKTTFRSVADPFVPGKGHGQAPHANTYGGHVYAQAAWAAAKTVLDGFLIHSITGYFILGGDPTMPFKYEVEILRNGGSYCTRSVKVSQTDNKICFTCTCSFKKEERNDFDVQDHVDLWKKYAAVLQDKTPENFRPSPNIDMPWYWKWRDETGHKDVTPGLEARKVDMSAYNQSRQALDKRQLVFYKPIGNMPEDPNLHLCAHLYASDHNGLFIVSNQFGVAEDVSQMGSLSHSVVFNSSPRRLMFSEANVSSGSQGNWWCKEDWSDRIANGRCVLHSRLWSPTGSHVATFMQEGMIRLSKSTIGSKI